VVSRTQVSLESWYFGSREGGRHGLRSSEAHPSRVREKRALVVDGDGLYGVAC
jgi:hypothetical protein